MNWPVRFRAVIFDVDGTLFDTLPGLVAAINDVLIAAGLRRVAADELRPALSAGLRPLFRRALALQPQAPAPDASDALEQSFMAHYTRRWLPQSALYEGAQDVLAALHAQPVRLGICTNRDRESTRLLLAAAELDRRFDVVVSLEDAARPKPAADPLLRVMERLQVAPAQALFVGDSALDAHCAAAAGVAFAAHRNGYASDAADLLPQITSFAAYAEFLSWMLARSSAFAQET